MKTIRLELDIDEINVILEALGHQPFVKVNAVIGRIVEQARVQIEPGESAEATREPARVSVLGG